MPLSYVGNGISERKVCLFLQLKILDTCENNKIALSHASDIFSLQTDNMLDCTQLLSHTPGQ